MIHKTSFTLPLFIKVPVPTQERVFIYTGMCARDIDFASVSRIFLLKFGTVLTIKYLLFFIVFELSYNFQNGKNVLAIQK
jgi:hypothetical protein